MPAGATALDHELVAALRTGVLRLARRLRVERASNDLTLSQISVLGVLRHRGPQTPGELAAAENVKPPSMTRLVAGLEAAGLVTRRPHDTDGRQVVVELTPAALDVLDSDRERRNQWLSSRFADLTDDELALLDRVAPLLERIAAS